MSPPPIIIIAASDKMVGNALRVEFTHQDFAVLIADDCRQAEDYAAQTIAHLVVLDIGAPHLSAFEACVRIRRRKRYENRPIVLTVNDADVRMQAAADKAGATALLRKPYSLDDLFHAVRPHLAADDLLLIHGMKVRPGAGEPHEWRAGPTPPPRLPDNSALTRNRELLPIVHGAGKKVPLVRIS